MYWPSKNNVERQNELRALVTEHTFAVASEGREDERELRFICLP